MFKNLDLTTAHASILIMLGLDVLFLGTLIWAFVHTGVSNDLRTILASAFGGNNGALLLALRGSGSKPDNKTDTIPKV